MTESGIATKIFGIGLNKTGTTTLEQCGKMLGYRCTSVNRELLDDVISGKDFTRINRTVNQFDLFQDWPYPLIFKELDQMFPGSKFILTVRNNEQVWLDSLKRHSLRTHPTRHCRKLAYGYSYPHRREQEYLGFYHRHNQSVRAYFTGRKSDFIEICWEKGDGWDALCTFLGKDIPSEPLPHSNRGEDQKVPMMRLFINRILSFSGR